MPGPSRFALQVGAWGILKCPSMEIGRGSCHVANYSAFGAERSTLQQEAAILGQPRLFGNASVQAGAPLTSPEMRMELLDLSFLGPNLKGLLQPLVSMHLELPALQRLLGEIQDRTCREVPPPTDCSKAKLLKLYMPKILRPL